MYATSVGDSPHDVAVSARWGPCINIDMVVDEERVMLWFHATRRHAFFRGLRRHRRFYVNPVLFCAGVILTGYLPGFVLLIYP